MSTEEKTTGGGTKPGFVAKLLDSFKSGLAGKIGAGLGGVIVLSVTPLLGNLWRWLWEQSNYPNGLFAVALVIVSVHAFIAIPRLWPKAETATEPVVPSLSGFNRVVIKSGIWSWRVVLTSGGRETRYTPHCPVDGTELKRAGFTERQGSHFVDVCPECGKAYGFSQKAEATVKAIINGMCLSDRWRDEMRDFDGKLAKLKKTVEAHNPARGFKWFDLGV